MRPTSLVGDHVRWFPVFSAVAVASACGSLASPPTQGVPDSGTGGSGIVVPSPGGKGGSGASKGGPVVDTRPVVTAERTPPPISGGTLLVLQEGGRAVVADSDRDTVSIVDLTGSRVEVSFPLEARAEPGRLVEDADGRVHVALRGTGELLTLDTRQNAAVDRRPACRAPRGVAYDPANDRVLVACQEGTLVELPAGAGEVVRSTQVAQDLRDVLFADGQLILTRFRSAELLYLDAERQVTMRVSPPSDGLGFTASVAWRAVPSPSGGFVVAHQRAFAGVIDVGADSGVAGAGGESGGGGEPDLELPTRSGYGQTAQLAQPCSSVVGGTLTFADTSGGARLSPRLDQMVLPVDMAVLNGTVAVANAAVSSLTGGSSIGMYDQATLESQSPEGCVGHNQVEVMSTIVAVAFDPTTGMLIAQAREPAKLVIMNDARTFVAGVLPLGGPSVLDTGHEIFHADSGGGIACASCHPEGTDDGHVWRFAGFGDRRTQPLDVGLEGTAPFHWDGDLPTFSHLMQDVFRGRMAGPGETAAREVALEQYVYGIPRRVAVRAVADAAALRGKALFESKDVGCSECHSGPKLTNGESENIGREEALQVPSLIAVSARAPYMHDGCAATLLDRFDPVCGGSRHGNVEGLEPSDLDDLVAYLETL
jgi:hypothetical protein